MDGVAVLAPLGGECPYRAEAWEWVQARYEAEGYEVIACELEGPWSKARALGDAAERTDAEIIVVADADSWCDGLGEAIQRVRGGAPWAVPHRRVHRLNAAATEAVLAGECYPLVSLPTMQRPYVGRAGGGMAVVRRESLLEVPWDRRFVTWGGADVCWARALKTLVGHPWRGTAPFFHLWHPPERIGKPNQELCDRYKAAAGDVEATRELVEEGRQA